MSPKKKTETKPTAHVHTHEYAPEVRTAQHLKNLSEGRDALLGIAISLGVTTRIYGKTGIKDRLPGQPKTLPPPELDGAHNRLKFSDGSTWSLKQFLESVLGGEENAAEFLRTKVSRNKPQLQRFFCFEAGDIEDPHRSVGDHPYEALAELHVPDGSKIRGIVIDCPPDLNLAKQLAGQQGTRKRFSWHLNVPVNKDGELIDVRWHGTWLTPLEQLLLKEQLGVERVAKVRRLRRESMMRHAETEWT